MEGFGFSEEQELFRLEMRRLVKNELAPRARDKDIAGEFMKAFELLNIPNGFLWYLSTRFHHEPLRSARNNA